MNTGDTAESVEPTEPETPTPAHPAWARYHAAERLRRDLIEAARAARRMMQDADAIFFDLGEHVDLRMRDVQPHHVADAIDVYLAHDYVDKRLLRRGVRRTFWERLRGWF